MNEAKGVFTLIRAGHLIDGNGGPPLERGAILVQGDTIRDVGTWESVLPPEGSVVHEIVYEDKTVMPGLVDCHVHLTGIGDGRLGNDLDTLPDEILTLQAARNARDHLYSGVTTVRDCGAKHQTTFMLRKAIQMGICSGPRLALCGRPVAIIGGHLSYFGIAATGADECRAAVRQLIKEGADFIKITATGGSTITSYRTRPSFNVEELKAICYEAHNFGKHTAAHCASSEGMARSLEAGVDTIIHAMHIEPDGTYKFNEEIAERIAKQGVYVNPTLGQARIRVNMLQEKEERDGLTLEERQELEQTKFNEELHFEQAHRMLNMGIKLVCGSDSAWAWYKMGNFQHEIECHVEAGMSPMEAIVSATKDSAASSWMNETVGTLKPGKQADLLVVNGNPSQDIKALREVEDVFLAGNRVDRNNYV